MYLFCLGFEPLTLRFLDLNSIHSSILISENLYHKICIQANKVHNDYTQTFQNYQRINFGFLMNHFQFRQTLFIK